MGIMWAVNCTESHPPGLIFKWDNKKHFIWLKSLRCAAVFLCTVIKAWRRFGHRKRLNASVGRGCAAVAQPSGAVWCSKGRSGGFTPTAAGWQTSKGFNIQMWNIQRLFFWFLVLWFHFYARMMSVLDCFYWQTCGILYLWIYWDV